MPSVGFEHAIPVIWNLSWDGYRLLSTTHLIEIGTRDLEIKRAQTET